MKKTIIRLIVWTLLCAPAYAQSPQLGAGQVLGNSTGSQRPAQAVGLSSLFDRAFCSTANSALARLSGSWVCLATANNAVWATNGSGVPSLTQTLPSAVQDNITRLNTITSGTWNGGVIPQLYGGTGATDAIGGRGALGLGTMATQNATGVAITGGTITGLPTPTSSNDAATKSYADSIAAGLSIRTAVQWATAAVLPNTPTYANGTAGVGATLTSTGNAALVVDGGSPTVGQRVLAKNEATASHNGVFSVTAAGSGAAQWVLTRVTDFDQPGEMIAGAAFAVVGSGGATNSGTGWSLSAAVTTVGTDPLSFNQFQSIAGALVASNNLSDVASATTARANLGLGTMATQNANSVAITGGALNGSLGATTPASASVTTLTTNGQSAFNGGYGYFGFNGGSGFPATGVGGAAAINQSGGGLDFSLINTFTTATQSFNLYQQTGASALTRLLNISPSGTFTFTGNNNTCTGVGGLAALSGAGVMSCTDFVQTGTGSSSRQWTTKVGETVSLTDFGAVSGGSTGTNNTAVANIQSAGYNYINVPNGAYATTKNFFNTTDITSQYVGPGQFTDASGNQRGKWFIPINTPLTSVGHYGDQSLWYNGDWSKNGIAVEQVITSQILQTGQLVTNASTAAGSAVLHFASVPSWVGVGANLSYRALQITATNIPAGTFVVSITSTTVTLSAAATGAGVANGATITFGANQFQNIVESAPVSLQIYAANGSLGGTGAFSAGQNTNGIWFNGINSSAGAGSIWGLNINCTVNAAWASYDPVNAPFSTPQCGILTGVANAQVDGVDLAPVEWSISDTGKQTTGHALILDMTRQYSGSVDHGVPGQYWVGILLNGGDSTKAIDAGMRWGGPYIYGADFTSATITNGALALKADQKILLNATAGSFGAAAPGDSSVWYSSIGQKIVVTVGNVDVLQFDNAGNMIIPNTGGIKFNGVNSLGGTFTVRNGAGTGFCSFTFVGGIATATTC